MYRLQALAIHPFSPPILVLQYGFWSSFSSLTVGTLVQRLNVLRTEGHLKVAGKLVCVSGTIFMVLVRAPHVRGDNSELVLATLQNEISARTQLEPVGRWFISGLLDFGVASGTLVC